MRRVFLVCFGFWFVFGRGVVVLRPSCVFVVCCVFVSFHISHHVTLACNVYGPGQICFAPFRSLRFNDRYCFDDKFGEGEKTQLNSGRVRAYIKTKRTR